MTATVESSNEGSGNISIVEGVINNETRLFAGKYKSVEELEKAYGHSVNAIREAKELKDKINTITTIPEDYSVPEGSNLREAEIQEIKKMAKEIGLTQDHFSKMASQMESKIKSNFDIIDKNKESLGEEKFNVINEYVKKIYPASLHETILNKLLRDNTAMSDAFKHRDQLLNSQVPGMDSGNTGGGKKYDGQQELTKAATDYQKNPNQANRDRYISLAREVGHERMKK